ncbi:hypothetical protein OVA07_14010 [Novosphingobium sp. SL115]|uniref:hypothetical protein n=1 Tax=Novosphingobium sp. SL115 TaxID=2995150 RepID=UPI00227376BF|nr:hypothetical protein [Novosphingobium sp. SL115]MCY1672118.1 hypothetical protein [Novosphingobium sp. SL115]
MAKTSDFDLAGPLTGEETAPILQDGKLVQTPLNAFLGSVIQPLVDETTAQAAAAAFAAQANRFQVDNRNTYLSISPGAAWNGTAGSGFAGAPPVDPVRVTAKPAGRLIAPPFQWFTDSLPVGVYAAANNAGDLDNLGLKHVIVHYEGSTVTIDQPSYHSFRDVNGRTVTYQGWWATLLNDARYGNAQVYFELVPRDATMQSRVIGPYQFSPKAAKYSHQIEIAATPAEVAGARYKTLNNALNYLKAQNATNPLITITESGDYDTTGPTNGWSNGSHINGYVHLTASVPATLTKPAPASNTEPGAHRPGVPMHLFGKNLTLDFKYASELWHSDSTGRNHWLDGINLTNSAGRYDLYRKGTRNGLGWLMRGQGAPTDGAWVTECTFSNLWNAALNTALVRGCTFNTCWSDLADHSLCFINNRIDDFDSTVYAIHTAAMTVTFPAGGTLERTSNTFTARVAGTAVGTFTVLSTLAGWVAGTNYDVSDVVAWINGLGAGWSATLLDDTRAAWTLVPYQGTYIPGTWPAQAGSGGTLTLGTTFDIHADWWQKQDGAVLQNIICANNVTTNYVGAIFLIGDLEDAVFINNAWHCKDVWGFGVRSAARSQMGDYMRHFVFAHNTAVNQLFWLRNDNPAIPFDADSYCLWASNTFEDFRWQGTQLAGKPIYDNHIHDGYALPANMTGTTQGGTAATLFPGAATGDFSPKTALVTNIKAPRIKHDMAGVRRGSASAVGAAA